MSSGTGGAAEIAEDPTRSEARSNFFLEHETMKELRTITITNGELFDNADIYTTEDGIVKLWLHSDKNHDAVEELVDDSNTSVMDVIRGGAGKSSRKRKIKPPCMYQQTRSEARSNFFWRDKNDN